MTFGKGDTAWIQPFGSGDNVWSMTMTVCTITSRTFWLLVISFILLSAIKVDMVESGNRSRNHRQHRHHNLTSNTNPNDSKNHRRRGNVENPSLFSPSQEEETPVIDMGSSSSGGTAVEATTIPKCALAQNRCIQSLGCSVAIQHYLIFCGPIIKGEIAECTYHCRIALISLLSTADENGKQFMTCDCEGDEFCMEQRTRLEVCQPEVVTGVHEVMDPDSALSCTLAEMVCTSDTQCLSALNYYHEHCRKLFKGEKCTNRCKNSMNILYRQPKASKLHSCYCDGMETFDCPELRQNTRTLCSSTNERNHKHRNSNSRTNFTSNRHSHREHKHNRNQNNPNSHVVSRNTSYVDNRQGQGRGVTNTNNDNNNNNSNQGQYFEFTEPINSNSDSNNNEQEGRGDVYELWEIDSEGFEEDGEDGYNYYYNDDSDNKSVFDTSKSAQRADEEKKVVDWSANSSASTSVTGGVTSLVTSLVTCIVLSYSILYILNRAARHATT